ncbi:MAG: RNA methyltransferase [Gemmataceae bacterium]
MLDCRIVLVRPHIAANLGATARVMRNFGLRRLVLVAPEADPADREARRLATHGEAILDDCQTVSDLGEAVADCVVVAATSARVGGPYRRQALAVPEAIMPLLAQAGGPTALVFGPETNGLTNAEIARCHHLIHIPTDSNYPALNLAQAVAICVYELRRAGSLGAAPPHDPPAPFAAQERMFEQLQAALEAIHFLYGPGGDTLMAALRHLIGRARPTATEVDILFGLARQLRWVREQGEWRGKETR